MGRAVVIGVMGPGEQASPQDLEDARQLGEAIAQNGWVLLSGGRDAGVMAAVNKAAAQAGGLTLGLLPGKTKDAAPDVLLPIPTDLGNARNNLNVLAGDAIVAVAHKVGPGTTSEIALALKNKTPVVVITQNPVTAEFFNMLAGDRCRIAQDVPMALGFIHEWIKRLGDAVKPIYLEQR